jgi:3'(2'), 5'-bisphosphate nucleotidase
MFSQQQKTDLLLPILQLALEAGREILRVYRSEDLQVEHKADFSPLTLADRRAHDIINAGLIRLAPDTPVLSEEGDIPPFPERKHWDEFWLVDPLDGTKEFIKGNGEFTVNIGLIQNGEPVVGVIYAPVCCVAYVGMTAPEGDSKASDLPRPGDGTAPAIGTGFPGSGAFRFVIHGDLAGQAVHADDLARQAEPIGGAAPETEHKHISIIASRSHMGRRTRLFVHEIGEGFEDVKLLHVGSSLKLCMIAEGSANIYPRINPTMEWDTAAGHALVRSAGGELWQAPRGGHKPVPNWLAGAPVDPGATPDNPAALTALEYNKKDLKNPPFVARGW